MKIIVTGNPVDGFEFFGPFEGMTDDISWRFEEEGDWWVASISPIPPGKDGDLRTEVIIDHERGEVFSAAPNWFSAKIGLRLAHAVADLKEAQRGPRANVAREYIRGLVDAVAALGGPMDCSIYMFQACDEVGKRPFSSAMNKERKQWEEDVLAKYASIEPSLT